MSLHRSKTKDEVEIVCAYCYKLYMKVVFRTFLIKGVFFPKTKLNERSIFSSFKVYMMLTYGLLQSFVTKCYLKLFNHDITSYTCSDSYQNGQCVLALNLLFDIVADFLIPPVDVCVNLLSTHSVIKFLIQGKLKRKQNFRICTYTDKDVTVNSPSPRL